MEFFSYNTPMNIVTLGHVDIDKNISENSSYITAGSPAMFMSKIFQQLPDCSSAIIAPYGKDFLPYIKEVKIYPSQPTTKHTLVYENITKAGKRIQKAFYYQEAIPVLMDEAVRIVLQKTDIIYIAPILPNISGAYLQDVIHSVPKDCLKILSPQGYFRQFDEEHTVIIREFIEADEILPQIDMVIVSEQDHPQMKQVAEKWTKKYNITVIVTTGKKGAEVFIQDQQFEVPTNPVSEKDIVDSVGSGDIFCAGFGYWYKQTNDLVSSVRFANALARECLFFKPDEIKINYSQVIRNNII